MQNMLLCRSSACLLTWLFLIGWLTPAYTSPSFTWEELQRMRFGSGTGIDTETDRPVSGYTNVVTNPTVPAGGNVTFHLTWPSSFPELLKSYRIEYRELVRNASTTSEHPQHVQALSVVSTLPPSSKGYKVELPEGGRYQFRVFITLKESGEELAIIDTSRDVAKCDDDWSGRQRSCYRSFTGTVSWGEASKRCRREEAHLVIIESEEENTFVKNVLGNSRASTAWIGLNDRKEEGNFVWMNGVSLRPSGAFMAWDGGEPNNHASEEHCVEIFSKLTRPWSLPKGVWNDAPCSRRRPGYFCESEGGLTPATETATTQPRTSPSLVRYSVEWFAPFPLQNFSVEHRRVIRTDTRPNVFGPWVIDAAALPGHTKNFSVELNPATYEFRVNGTLEGVAEPLELLKMQLGPEGARPTQQPADRSESLWKEYDGSYYAHFNVAGGITWFNANRSCERRGGHLVIITSKRENTFVNSLAGESFNQASRRSWIGLSDSAEEGRFVWVNGKDLLPADMPRPYSKWDRGEPNNRNHRGPENCVAMWSKGTWNDFFCSQRSYLNGYICEKDVNDWMNAEKVNIKLQEPPSVQLARGLYEVGELRHDLLIERYGADGKFRRYGLVEDVSYPIDVALYRRGGFYQIHQLVHTDNGLNYTLASSVLSPGSRLRIVGTQVPFVLGGITVRPRTSHKKFALRVKFPKSLPFNQRFPKKNKDTSWEIHYRRLGSSEVHQIIVPLFRSQVTIPNLPIGNYEVHIRARNLNTSEESSTFTTTISGLCGHRWTWENGKCYRLHYPLHWTTAGLLCNLQGGKLTPTYDKSTKAVLSRVAAAGLQGLNVTQVWATRQAESNTCTVVTVSSDLSENSSCDKDLPFMCERDDLSVHTTPAPDSQMVLINEPFVGIPPYWQEATSHSIVIEKFNSQKNQFEKYMTTMGIIYPYKVRLQPGFYQFSHVAMVKRSQSSLPVIKYVLERSTFSVQYTGERPYEVTGVKVLRHSERSTAQRIEPRPPVVWTVELPQLPAKHVSTYNHWRIVYSGHRVSHGVYGEWKHTKSVPILHGKSQTVDLQAVPDYGMAIDVTAVGNNGQESNTFTVIVG